MKMSTHTGLSGAIATLLAAVGTLASGPLAAVTITRIPLQNAVADCNGALPSFEGKLRKRPTAIANEGTGLAFITCSMQADELGNGNTFAAITFTNRGATDATVNCNMVTNTVNGPTYFSESVQVLAGMGTTHMIFDAGVINGGLNFANHINFSCGLPPGVEVNYTYRIVEEEVGA